VAAPGGGGLIGWMGRGGCAARAARVLVRFFGVVCRMAT